MYEKDEIWKCNHSFIPNVPIYLQYILNAVNFRFWKLLTHYDAPLLVILLPFKKFMYTLYNFWDISYIYRNYLEKSNQMIKKGCKLWNITIICKAKIFLWKYFYLKFVNPQSFLKSVTTHWYIHHNEI